MSEGSIPKNDQGNVEAVLDRVSFLKLSFVFPIYGLDLGKVRVSGTCVLTIHKTVARRPFLTRKRIALVAVFLRPDKPAACD